MSLKERLQPLRAAVKRRLEQDDATGRLVLGRYVGQSIYWFDARGEYCGKLTIAGIDRGQVRLVVDAPAECVVTRGELLQ